MHTNQQQINIEDVYKNTTLRRSPFPAIALVWGHWRRSDELINGQSNLRLSPRPIKTRINEDSLLNQKFVLRDNRRLRLIGVYL